MPLSSISNTHRESMFPIISGKFSSLLQPLRIRIIRDFILIFGGKFARLEHLERSNVTSLLRNPIEGSTSIKLVQPLRSKYFRFSIPEKSGIFSRNPQSVKFRDVSFAKFCETKQQKGNYQMISFQNKLMCKSFFLKPNSLK